MGKSRHYIQNNKKKSIKISQSDEVDEEGSSEDDEKINITNTKLKSVKFSDHLIEEKASYIKPKKYNRKFGHKDNKLLFKKTESLIGLN